MVKSLIFSRLCSLLQLKVMNSKLNQYTDIFTEALYDVTNNGTNYPLEAIDFGARILSMEYSCDGKSIIVTDEKGNITLVNPNDLSTIEKYTDMGTCYANFNPNRTQMITATSDGRLKIWDKRNDRFICSSILKGHIGKILGVQYSRNGKYIMSIAEDNTLKIWDAETLQCIITKRCSSNNSVFSDDGNSIFMTEGWFEKPSECRTYLYPIVPLKDLINQAKTQFQR